MDYYQEEEKMTVKVRRGKTRSMEYVRISLKPIKTKIFQDNQSFFKAEYHLQNKRRVHVTINKTNGNISVEELKTYVDWSTTNG